LPRKEKQKLPLTISRKFARVKLKKLIYFIENIKENKIYFKAYISRSKPVFISPLYNDIQKIKIPYRTSMRELKKLLKK
jgi:hypothetical protein